MGMVYAFAVPLRDPFLRDFRELIPAEDRHFVKAKGTWIVHPRHTHDVEDLLLQHYADLWRKRHTQEPPRPREQPEQVGADVVDPVNWQSVFGPLMGALFAGAARASEVANRAEPQAVPPAPPPPENPFEQQPSGIDDYKTLHVWPGAPIEVAKAAYIALCKIHHTDRGGDAETMKRINVAWDRIRDDYAEARQTVG